MEPFIIAQTVDLAGENPPRLYRQALAWGDSGAHRWEVRIVRGGQAADLTGCTAAVLARREDDESGVTVRQGAAIEGNVASAEFLPEVYALGGRLLAVMVISDASGRVVTSAALRMQGKQYTTGSISDPEGTIPSLEALLARYNDLLSATEAAKAATADARAATEATQAAIGDAQTALSDAQQAVSQAQLALGTAQTAADTANAAAAKINEMTVSATPVETGTATAALSTVDGHYHLALGLPKGDTGATPRISVQVQTGAAGSEASVSVSGTAEEPVIHLTIPRGETGRIENLTINGKTPDAGGAVTLGMGDIDGLSDAIANAGGVKTVAGVGPDSAGNVPLTAEEVGARPSSWTPTAAEVGARPSSWTPTAAEVGARPSSWTPTAAEVGARPSSWTPTAAEVGALAVGGTAADSAKLGGKAPGEYAGAAVVSAHEASLGDAWNSGTAYAAGAYCIYGNALYRCQVANTGVVPANGGSEWKRCTVAGELKAITDANAEVTLVPQTTTLNVGSTFAIGAQTPRVLGVRINGSTKYAATRYGDQFYGSYVNINEGNMFSCRLDCVSEGVYQISISKMCTLSGGSISDVPIKGINILVM